MFGEGAYVGWFFAGLAWFGVRILLALAEVVINLWKGEWTWPFLKTWLMPVSCLAGGVMGAAGWHFLFTTPNEIVSVVLSIVGFVAGLFVALFIDLRLFFGARRLGAALLATRLPALTARLQSPDGKERLDAARKLHLLGPRSVPAVPALLDALRDENAEVRSQAALAVLNSNSEDDAVAPAMRQALNDPDPRVRTGAACTLVRLKAAEPSVVLPALVEGLKDPESLVYHDATYHLGELGPAAEPALPALVEAMYDKERKNWSLCDTFAKIGEAGVPALIEALGHEDVDYRSSAAHALGTMGPKAQEAIPALHEALKDRSDAVRRSAAKAIEQVMTGTTL